MTPRPPACAIAIAMRASVTVSMADAMIGMLSGIARVTRERISASEGSTSDEAGFQKHVVEREGFTDTLQSLRPLPTPFGGFRRDQTYSWMNAASGAAIGVAVEIGAPSVGLAVVDSMAARQIKAFAGYALGFAGSAAIPRG